MGAEFLKFLASRPGRYVCNKCKNSRVGLALARFLVTLLCSPENWFSSDPRSHQLLEQFIQTNKSPTALDFVFSLESCD